MFIYNIKQNSNAPCYHILDPDYIYNTSLEQDLLYPYFKNLIMPQSVQTLLGIYMEYQIEDYSFQQYPQLYQKFTTAISEKIKQYLDFGCANLFINDTNSFFLTMFNVEANKAENAILSFIEDINKRHVEIKNKQHYFQIKSGLYFSHPYIDPYIFYNSSKQQFHNTICNNAFISIKPYSFSFEKLSYNL